MDTQPTPTLRPTSQQVQLPGNANATSTLETVDKFAIKSPTDNEQSMELLDESNVSLSDKCAIFGLILDELSI